MITVADIEKFALSMPEAWLDHPWGERAVKVRKKMFLLVWANENDRSSIVVKLPESREHALSFPESRPTGHNLGRHGWVTLYLDRIPEEEREVAFDFVEESYCAIAPKTLVTQLGARGDSL